jgi:hypothetical protein
MNVPINMEGVVLLLYERARTVRTLQRKPLGVPSLRRGAFCCPS